MKIFMLITSFWFYIQIQSWKCSQETVKDNINVCEKPFKLGSYLQHNCRTSYMT